MPDNLRSDIYSAIHTHRYNTSTDKADAVMALLADPVRRLAILDAMNLDVERMADSGLYDSYGNPPRDIGELIIRLRGESDA